MIDYLCGTLINKHIDRITLEVNNVGYSIVVSNTNDYIPNNIYTVYIYLNINNEVITLYGFNNINKRDLFLQIINVKGIGPKTAINMFKNYNEKEIIDAINEENIHFLKSLPNIGLKSAKQIILDLKGKLINNDLSINKDLIDVKYALKNLGFKSIDIDNVLKDLSKEKHNLNDYIKIALIRLNKK